jgi:hypothetical protein
MAFKESNKGPKSKNSAASSGKQSTPPLTEKNPSQIRLTIKEYTPELAAEVSTSTGASGRKKEKLGGEASEESKPSSSSSSSSLPSSSSNQQQSSSSSNSAAVHNSGLDDTFDADYDEDESGLYNAQGAFCLPEFADLAYDRWREKLGSPLSDTTDQYGEEDDSLPVKQAAKADAMKDARYQRRRILKQRLTDLNDRGLVDNDAHNLLSWEQLVDVYLSEREQNERTKGNVQGALDDRDTALKQVKEHKQLVQVERDKITRLKDQ